MARKIKIAVFSGGRGTTSICEAFQRHKDIELTLLVNAYDDGLSTGRMRRFVPGLLGPSDIRKSLSRLISGKDKSAKALKVLLEYRFPAGTAYERAVAELEQIGEGKRPLENGDISQHYANLSVRQVEKMAEFTRTFLAFAESRAVSGEQFDFGDCSLGNILFAGCFIKSGSFNLAITELSEFCELPHSVLNVTLGENYILAGIKTDGTVLRNEEAIVSQQSTTPLQEVFLLERYMTDQEYEAILKLSFEERIRALRKISKTPQLNPDAAQVLQEADIIIYGPGTQHSSLFPSYLTAGLAESIAANITAEKIFISNIRKDFEIQSETANSLAHKLFFYLNRKGEIAIPPAELATRFFFQGPSDSTEKDLDKYIKFIERDFDYGIEKVVGANWESTGGVHMGGRVLDELVAIANTKAQTKLEPLPYMVSIVVPALNEETTVRKVLHDLLLVNFQEYGIGKEIIFVDGGSTDRTFEYAKAEEGVRCYQPGVSGRGEALRWGIKQAQGNIIAFFPSDDEYDATDLPNVVLPIVRGEFPVVFGSRAIKCVNLSRRIWEIYRGQPLGYLVSKYGGMALSILSLLFYNRFVSDPLTGVKAFQARVLKGLELTSRGVDLETEIIAKLSKRGAYIMELPIAYHPRLKSDGKKTTMGDGLRALLKLISVYFLVRSDRTAVSEQVERSYEKAISSNTSV